MFDTYFYERIVTGCPKIAIENILTVRYHFLYKYTVPNGFLYFIAGFRGNNEVGYSPFTFINTGSVWSVVSNTSRSLKYSL